MPSKTYGAKKFPHQKNNFQAGDFTSPALATSYTGQFDAFEDQRQFAQPHLDARHTVGRVQRLGHFKGPKFKPLVKNHQPVAHEVQHLHAIAAAIKKQEQMATLDRLFQLLLDDAHQTRKNFFACPPASCRQTHSAREGTSALAGPRPKAKAACNTA